MKKTHFILAICMGISALGLMSFEPTSSTKKEVSNPTKRISFKIKGTGSKGITVKIGVGSQIGSGACCSSVSPMTTAGFSGEIGHVVYDSERKRIITKIYQEMEGQVIDLKSYY
jgi:hypothetical protein